MGWGEDACAGAGGGPRGGPGDFGWEDVIEVVAAGPEAVRGDSVTGDGGRVIVADGGFKRGCAALASIQNTFVDFRHE